MPVSKAKNVLVLLVEDNIGDAHLVLSFLKGSSVPNRVVVVRDGPEALDYIKGTGAYAGNNRPSRPDLILLDLRLPTMDGKEVLREVKTDEDLKLIPVVIFTGSQSEDEIHGCYESSANYYIVKPAGLSEFIEAMNYIEKVWLKPLVSGV